jgi:hypothetical protein
MAHMGVTVCSSMESNAKNAQSVQCGAPLHGSVQCRMLKKWITSLYPMLAPEFRNGSLAQH